MAIYHRRFICLHFHGQTGENATDQNEEKNHNDGDCFGEESLLSFRFADDQISIQAVGDHQQIQRAREEILQKCARFWQRKLSQSNQPRWHLSKRNSLLNKGRLCREGRDEATQGNQNCVQGENWVGFAIA